MSGGGPRYERLENVPPPEQLLLGPRLERIDEVVSLRTRSLTVVLDRLEDTFNMAAVLRTCEGLGIQEVHVVPHEGEGFSPNSTVTQGCDKWLDVLRHDNFKAARDALKARGFQILVSTLDPQATSVFEMKFEGKVALVFGNEREGVSAEVRDLADGFFWIPMRGFVQSFNISVAVSAALSQAIGARLKNKIAGDLSETEKAELTSRFQMLSVKQRNKLYSK